ncbi:MAG: PA14 domain-containing protein, partial [Pseudomonadota bacterium]
GALTWSVDDARFEVVGETVRLRDGVALDHEATPQIDLTLTATDPDGLSSEQTVRIFVGDEITQQPDVSVESTFHVRQIGVVDTVTDIIGIDWGSDPIGEAFVNRVDLSRSSDCLIDIDATDAFAMLVTGFIDAEVAGTYDLRLPASDTAILWIDGAPVALDAEPGILGLAEVSLTLTEGPHEIAIQHLDLLGDGALQFEWRPPGATDFELVPPTSDFLVEEGDELGIPLEMDLHGMSLASVVIQDLPANWILSDGQEVRSSTGGDLDITSWNLDQLSISPAVGDIGTTAITIQTTTVSPSGEPGTTTSVLEIEVLNENGFSIEVVDIATALAAEGLDFVVDDVLGGVLATGDDDPDDSLLDPPPDTGGLLGGGSPLL